MTSLYKVEIKQEELTHLNNNVVQYHVVKEVV